MLTLKHNIHNMLHISYNLIENETKLICGIKFFNVYSNLKIVKIYWRRTKIK